MNCSTDLRPWTILQARETFSVYGTQYLSMHIILTMLRNIIVYYQIKIIDMNSLLPHRWLSKAYFPSSHRLFWAFSEEDHLRGVRRETCYGGVFLQPVPITIKNQCCSGFFSVFVADSFFAFET